MIVLRRRVGQAICIGNDIRIVITEVEPNTRAHLGIEAPTSIPVHRLEIYEKIHQENCAATQGDTMAWLKGAANDS
ncbi:MAG: carbon storage regulator [Zetaproteobacteria bacterium CG12_big_fil_rev_8_21_14_0_65_55_1124]|nr:MAG: carbon storage regulator [Zetaproteobacteria bacterium CG1_02_55_237]PIS18659.1 MAG: carbon storage regulator [Zetaproteobacteria bacterium CG08_land_8_20_14_0_20_55_17]PIW43264.1 MAG: carbon storage regulator [Zetaproteobacteria bacterium CG12_big_fil_rev_8_21_14_0_65_55_1124]PIY53394.1 MAG: carbon storage regulator [Zetaproteobacteria bacterium CG_4_10_14_0_8_um_filter_55_43]PIZ38703.1 MAG: carbon storage regulator [Zetaproteobacteria bacterium CG_4_10_14_0_2_um_filter_55_20]PJB82567